MCCLKGHSQPVFNRYLSSYPRILQDNNQDTLQNAFSGGMQNPQLNNIDLNGDGLLDLVIFDGLENRLLTYLAVKKGNTTFRYAPEYQQYFPKGTYYYFLVDLNKDGKQDIVTHAAIYNRPNDNTALRVFKNVSTTGKVKFEPWVSQLQFRTSRGISPIYAIQSERPCFADVDGDGDVDMLMMNAQISTQLLFYRNDADKYPSKDTIALAFVDACYGKFQESIDESSYLLGMKDCPKFLTVSGKNGAAHAGSTLMAQDLDGDGDVDLVIGDISTPQLTVMINGKINGPKAWIRDSFISQNTFFPPNNYANLQAEPIPQLVDIDNDGDNDLVLTPYEQTNPALTNYSWYYENKFDGFKPVYEFKTSNLLESQNFDLGRNSHPCFVDLNGDGLQDVLIGVYGFNPIENKISAQIWQFQQKKTNAGRPYFQRISKDYLNIGKQDYAHLKPMVGDVNGDGIQDLIIGNSFSNVMYYKGIRTGTNLSFQFVTDAVLLDKKDGVNTNRLNVGGYSYPSLVDVNGDGKSDLIIGSGAGPTLRYYRFSKLFGEVPMYYQITDTFRGIVLTQINNISVKNLTPSFIDLNKDGNLDLLLGNNIGQIMAYYDILSSTTPVAKPMNVNVKGSFIDTLLGNNTSPIASFIDGDNDADLLIGNQRGGLFYLGSVSNPLNEYSPVGISKVFSTNTKPISVYPNPANSQINIRLPETANVYQCAIYDTQGKLILSFNNIRSGNQSINTESLKSGLYFIQFNSNTGENFANKFQISK